MFTGLVSHVGRVVGVEARAAGARLVVDAHGWGDLASRAVEAGESISVGGVCLTALGGSGAGRLEFDVVGETLARTTLGDRRGGDRVNLERSVRAGDLMGGHVVQGHVDGVALVTRVERGEGDWRVEFELGGGMMEFVVPKGSVTVEGVSLTVARVDAQRERFGVALVPTTLERTTLGELGEGGRVNVETDVVSRTIVHWLREYGGGGRG